MEIDDSPGSFFRLQEGHVLPVIHKEILCQDSWAAGVSDDIEVLLDVGISIGEVSPEAHLREPGLRNFIEFCGQGIRLGLTSSRKAAPAPSIEPIPAVSSGINVNGEENYLIVAELPADGVYAAAALLQGDVFALGNYELGIKAQGKEPFPDQEGKVSVIGVFAEVAVGAPFAGRVNAVAVVEEDLHSASLGSDCKMKI